MSTNIPSTTPLAQQILCYYTNSTSNIQVALINNIPGCRLEQVLFPGQRWMFWSDASAILDIYVANGSTEVQRVCSITCEALKVVETEPS